MKTRLWSLLAALFLVSSIVVFAPPLVGAASAAVAAVSVAPISGPPGTTVTVTGTGYLANEPNIVLKFNSLLVKDFITANASGFWSTTFVAPAYPAATYDVDGVGPTTGTLSTNFEVTPGLAISPASGPGGTVVTVTGTGFQFGDAIAVTFDGAPIATIPVAPPVSFDGSWAATFVVPATGGGPHTVDASGTATSAASVPDRTFTTPNMALIPTTGPVGTVVTVNAVGFQSGETGIRVLWDGAAVTTRITADGNGSWSATFVVPAAAGGAYTVDARGTTTTAAMVPNQTFTVTPEVKVTGSGSRPGETVTVTGTGFGAYETGIVVTWDGAVALAVGTASANGGWVGTLTIPNAAHGPHNINAYGNATPAGAAANVSQFVGHSFNISPSSGRVGTLVTVNGSGFYVNETGIQALFNGTAVRSGITAGANGTWSTTFTVPATARGSYLVNARGDATTTSQVPGKTFVVSPAVSINPISGYVGQAVSVNGAGFAGNSVVSITYDGTAATTTPASIVSTATGNVSASFTVPSSGPGVHAVVLNDGQGTLSASFTITSSVSSTMLSGTVGAQPTLNGLGFPLNSAVTFAFDNAAIATTPASVTTDSSGAFSATLTIPDAARGTHTVRVSSGATVLTTRFEVSPKLTVTPDSGVVGASVTLTGKGFGGVEPIAFTVDGVAVTSTPATVSAATNGNFTATLALPVLPAGSHVIKAVDRAASAQVSVTVTSKVVTGATAAKVGDKINAVGSGFPANGVVTVTVDGAATTTSPAPLTADAQGIFNADVTIPAAAFGNHTMTFTSGNSTSQATFSVSSSFAISPSDGNVGSSITLSGAGYAAGSAITVTYDGAVVATIPSPLAATSAGSFQAAVAAPKSAHGQHVMAASDAAGHSVPAAFTMEFTPPPAPALLSPLTGTHQGTLGAEKPAFSWGQVSDPSGVIYTLQVSKDPGFASPVAEKSSLTATSYQLAENEKLGRGYYYWRVKATDGASNESGWSQTFVLKIGMLPTWMPMWMFVAFIVIGLGIVAGLVYLFGFSSRTNRI